jgi:hypothetical protein
MLLTPEQLMEIRRIIEDHHDAFIINTMGDQGVDDETMQRLRDKGLLDEVGLESIKEAYLYGQLLAMKESAEAAGMTYDQFKAYVRANPIPLSAAEKHAVDLATYNAGQYTKGLGNTISAKTGALLTEGDQQLRAALEAQIRDKTAQNIMRRETVKQLKTDLAWASRDWSRDWDRIAVTEKQTAMEQGKADFYREKHGAEVRVAKRPNPGACKHCERLYLGPDDHPRIFKFSTLEANGTNVGRKAADWLPVVGTTHPNCFSEGTLITTSRGDIPIENVEVGDRVLSHDSKWHPVTALIRNQYEGGLVLVRGEGWELSATPNHPLYVDGNWIDLGSLYQGTHLVEKIGGINTPVLHDGANNKPAMTNEVVGFFRIFDGVLSSGMPITAIDFNGDFFIRDCEIDIVDIGRELWDRNNPSVPKLFEHETFVPRIEFTDTGLSYFGAMFSRIGRTPAGLVCGERIVFSSLGGEQTISNKLSLRTSSRNSTSFFDSANNSGAADTQPFSYFLHREQIIKVHFDDSSTINIYPFRHNKSPELGVDCQCSVIIETKRKKHKGLVYNLSVEGAESYFANNILVHNCMCSLFRVPEGWGFSEDGTLAPKGKHGVEYEDEKDISLALREEYDLQKSFQVAQRITYQDIPVAIENPVGSVRKWKDAEGRTGETRMLHAYGYIENTVAGDDDELDAFVGPDPRASHVFVIGQQDPATGRWEEQKCFLGFTTEEQAIAAYREHYDRPDRYYLDCQGMTIEQFRRWVETARPVEGAMMKRSERVETKLVIPIQTVRRSPVTDELQKARLDKSMTNVSGLQKAKYISRKRGKDGKWIYKYKADQKKEKKAEWPDDHYTSLPDANARWQERVDLVSALLWLGKGWKKTALVNKLIANHLGIYISKADFKYYKDNTGIIDIPFEEWRSYKIGDSMDRVWPEDIGRVYTKFVNNLEKRNPRVRETVSPRWFIQQYRNAHGLESTEKAEQSESDLKKAVEGQARGGKYVKRVPYYDKHGKKKYRYYYRESAIARDVKAGETLRLGTRMAEVEKVDPDGTVHLTMGETTIKVAANKWDKLVSSYYGDAYYKWAEKRAMQSVNAVLRHVPREQLADLRGSTDEERLADLKKRVPAVYEKLQKSFARAGVNPYRAKQILAATLERRNWEPEARAAVIGNVITKRNKNFRMTIEAAENLAGGGRVAVKHVGAATEITKPEGTDLATELENIAKKAEKEMAELASMLAKAKESGGDAKVLARAINAHAMAKLDLIAKAFPGLADRAVKPVRDTLAQVPAAAPKRAPTTDGASTTVFVAGVGGKPTGLKAKYKLVEAMDAIASHDPRSFNRRDDYPEGVQERAYHRDQAEQAKVLRNAQTLRPEFVVNTNPDAVNGPPVMSADGVVLGGNSRTMSVQLAYANHPEKAAAMRSYLEEHAHEAGFTKEDVRTMKNPMLVRVVEHGGETKQEKQLLVRQMNESFTQSMDPRTMQVAMGRKLSEATLEELGSAMGPDETLNKFLSSKKSEGFVNALMREGIIDQRNSNQYFQKGTKRLNPDGQTLVARILVGRTVEDADLLSATRPSVINNLAQAIPFITQARAHGEKYDLSKDLRIALDAYNGLQNQVDQGYAKALSADMSDAAFSRLFAQQNLIGDAPPVTTSKRAMDLLEVLIRRPGSTQLTNVFRDYAEQAKRNPEGQSGMFGEAKSGEEVFSEVAARHNAKADKQKEAQQGLALSLEDGDLEKGGGPYIGPRGGKWQDPQHTIPWKNNLDKKTKSALHGQVVRPEGWETTSDRVNDLFNEWSTRKNSAWRGMTEAEYKATVKQGRGVKSRGDYSHSSEGTQFADHPGDSESYINYGRDDPRKTGTPTYLVEVKREGLSRKPDGYLETKPGIGVAPEDILSVHKMFADTKGQIIATHLEKSLAKEIATQDSPAGNRAPGAGLGVNYVAYIPEKDRDPDEEEGDSDAPTPEDLVYKPDVENDGGLRRDREDYHFQEPYRTVHPIEIGEYVGDTAREAREGTEERMENVKKESERNRAAVINTAKIGGKN